MRIQLIEKDPALLEALKEACQRAGADVLTDIPADERGLALWQPQCDLVIAGQHPAFADLTTLNRTVWPIPLAALLPISRPQNVLQAAHSGAVDVCDREADAAHLAEWVGQLCAEHQTSQANAGQNDYFRSEACSRMRTLEDTIARVARTDSAVLIVGETGTGKELAARQVHRISMRGDKPIVTVNCAAIPETLIESELFGYEKGAFTGATASRLGLIEAADGGTLFLDEIGELPLAAQARLLRFMQEGEIRRIGSVTSKRVDVRLICATHRNLAELAARSEFREDLFYRIDVLRLDIPALRERDGDIVAMANWFIDKQAAKLGVPAKPLSEDSRDALAAHRWPGNVRELQNVIERSLVMSQGAVLHITLSGSASLQASRQSPNDPPGEGGSMEDAGGELSLEDYFQRFVLQHQDAMNETELAQKLGISRKCLWERRQRFGIPRQKQKSA
jgi:DNA-binding NtrC family response regulator